MHGFGPTTGSYTFAPYGYGGYQFAQGAPVPTEMEIARWRYLRSIGMAPQQALEESRGYGQTPPRNTYVKPQFSMANYTPYQQAPQPPP